MELSIGAVLITFSQALPDPVHDISSPAPFADSILPRPSSLTKRGSIPNHSKGTPPTWSHGGPHLPRSLIGLGRREHWPSPTTPLHSVFHQDSLPLNGFLSHSWGMCKCPFATSTVAGDFKHNFLSIQTMLRNLYVCRKIYALVVDWQLYSTMCS